MKKDYWQKRFEQMEESLFDMGASAYATIEKSFRKAQKGIQNQIETWYNRIAQNNNVTLLQAKRKLKGNELEEFRWSVEEYIAKAKENAVNQKWIKELENASARVHITRLEALQLHTQQLLEVAYANQLDTVDNMVRAVYMESFNRASWILQTGTNTAAFMGEIDERQLDKIIKRPWTVDGKEFSERIWGNRTVMINELHQEMIRTLIRGGTPDEAIKHMAKFVDDEGKSAMKKAARLVQTEQAYFSTISKMESYKELDVEQYQIIATFDLQTSKKCQEMDKQVFKVEEMHIGVNAPPFHPNCRTTTAPYHDEVYFRSTRAARDGDGKTIQVPEDMTYAEWYEEYGRKYQAKVDEKAQRKKEKKEKGLQSAKNDGNIENNLGDEEMKAISDYTSSESYFINEALRNHQPLTKNQQEMVDNLDSALKKMPTYKGNLTRSIHFDRAEDIEKFLSMYQVGNEVRYNQYISTTFGEVYNPDAPILIHIMNASKGRDISEFNFQESEILYERDSVFSVLAIEKNKAGVTKIFMEEV